MLFILSFLFFGCCAGDRCTNFIELWPRVDAIDCYRSVNFSYFQAELVDIATAYSSESETFYLDWTVFRQTLKAGSPSYDIKLDVDKNMTELITKDFESWYDAELALNKIFRYARDGHFKIGMNGIFKSAYYFHPVGLSSKMNGTTQVLTMKTVNTSMYLGEIQANYSLMYESHDFESMHGKIITSINGMEPFEYIKELCRGYAFSRDDSTCLNALIQEKSAGSKWHTRLVDNIGVPEGPLHYELADPVTFETSEVTLDFLSCIGNTPDPYSPALVCSQAAAVDEATLQTLVESYSRRRSAGINEEDGEKTRDDILEERGREKMKRILSFEPSSTRRESQETATPSVGILCQGYQGEVSFAFYKFVGHDDTAVLYINSMSAPSMAYKNLFYNCFDTALDGITKLVIDLRENGGGDLLWANVIGQGLMKRTMVHPTLMMSPMLMTRRLFANDWPKSGLSDFFFFPEPGTHYEVEMTESDDSTSYFSPYSWYDLTQEMLALYPSIKDLKGITGYEPEDIVILTDGSCGSACGMMMKNMAYAKAARVWHYGGILDEDADIGSFDGAGSQTRGKTNPPLAGGASKFYQVSWAMYFTPTFDGFFDKTELDYTKPLAFDILNGDRRIPIWEGMNPQNDLDIVFNAVLEMNKTCEEWNIKIDPSCDPASVAENAIYGRPCIEGEYDMGATCVMKRCEVGWYMDEAKTVCKRIEDAPIYSTFLESQKIPIQIPPVPDMGVVQMFRFELLLVVLFIFLVL